MRYFIDENFVSVHQTHLRKRGGSSLLITNHMLALRFSRSLFRATALWLMSKKIALIGVRLMIMEKVFVWIEINTFV